METDPGARLRFRARLVSKDWNNVELDKSPEYGATKYKIPAYG